MTRRHLLLIALIWLPFLMLPAFAAFGDTSYPHIAFHVVAIPMLVGAVVLVRRLRAGSASTAQRRICTALLIFVPLAVLGHVAELATALVRFAQDGFVNRDTADVWVSGPHFHAANVTVPSMMLAMVTVLVLAATAAVQSRSKKESSPSVGARM